MRLLDIKKRKVDIVFSMEDFYLQNNVIIFSIFQIISNPNLLYFDVDL